MQGPSSLKLDMAKGQQERKGGLPQLPARLRQPLPPHRLRREQARPCEGRKGLRVPRAAEGRRRGRCEREG